MDRFRAQATKAAQAQSRQKLIDKIDEERIVLPKRYSRRGRLRLAEPPPSGIEMFRCENMFFSYDGVKNVLHDVTFNVARGDKVAVIGYNGLGKTTLMRIIAGTRQPTAGKAVLGHNVVCGYLSQEFAETIPPDLTVYRNAKNAIPPGMNEKNFRNQLGAFGFDENDVEKPAGVLSGGEKIRLAFLRLFLQCPNFLLLDEPTTHLDLDGRALLQDALRHRVRARRRHVRDRDHARGGAHLSGRLRLLLREEGAAGEGSDGSVASPKRATLSGKRHSYRFVTSGKRHSCRFTHRPPGRAQAHL